MTTAINQLVNQQLDHMVKKNEWLGLLQGHLKKNTVWTKSKTPRPADNHIGNTFQIPETEPGEAVQDAKAPINISTTNALDIIMGGNTPAFQKYGYYNGACEPYSKLTRVAYDDLHQEFFNTLDAKTQWLAETAALTRDLQARRKLNQAYHGGRVYVTTASAVSTSTLALSDVSGMMYVWDANGIQREVSASNPLSVTITNDTVGTVTRNITSVTPGTRDDSSDRIPGSVGLSAAIAEIDIGDPVVSSQESPTLRPNSRSTDYNLQAGDLITLDMCFNVTSIMMSHGVGPAPEYGRYLFIGHTDHFYQLWKDERFALAFQGRYDSAQFSRGQAIEVGNIIFDFTHQPATYTTPSGVVAKRALVLGEGALDDLYYKSDPKQSYVSSDSKHNISYDAETRTNFIQEKNVGAQADLMHMSFKGYWGFAARRDSLAKFGSKPNASAKRCVGITTA